LLDTLLADFYASSILDALPTFSLSQRRYSQWLLSKDYQKRRQCWFEGAENCQQFSWVDAPQSAK
jgi:hypothetical protein